MEVHFEIIDHTADIGIRGWGKDTKSAFISCAAGLFHLIGDVPESPTVAEISKEISSFSWEELLVEWLNELVYEFDVNHYYLCDFRFNRWEQYSLSSSCRALQIPEDGVIRHYVKAVTYYGALVRKVGNGWLAQVYVDI